MILVELVSMVSKGYQVRLVSLVKLEQVDHKEVLDQSDSVDFRVIAVLPVLLALPEVKEDQVNKLKIQLILFSSNNLIQPK